MVSLADPAAGFREATWGGVQWRRQGLMVGEAHLVDEASIFNVKYIIHEYGLPTICRPPPGRYLLGRYTYTGLQHFFRTSPASLRNVHREKENVEQIYLPNNSITSLPDSSTVFYKNLISASELKPRKMQKTALTKH